MLKEKIREKLWEKVFNRIIEESFSVCVAGKVLEIDVLDHVIVGDGRFVSLKERGLM